MLITISILALVAIGFFLFHRTAKKSLDRQLSGAVTAVQAATYKRLLRRYQTDTGKGVAVAITNELFGQEPTAEVAVSFKKGNRDLIAQKLSELKNDNDLRVAVTDANRVLASLQYRAFSGERRMREIHRVTAHLEKLIAIGILLPNRPAPQELPLFITMVRKYHEQNAVEGEP